MSSYEWHNKAELEALKGKHVRIAASGRMMKRCRLHINGMWFRVIDVLPTNELFLEPLIPAFKDELQLLSIGLNGIEWGIADVLDNPNLLEGKA
ncbi:MAG: hypothetical protein P0Y55_11820 [Candidatus Cohnella colombiensis]|uniref:Uncharacterized protein n=1 Tax=Candidatus Cohnella colombiensis TaxID=3121368 RepID=A0AA95JF33_9BACL|nr:MAG: hypothetical protein P0Y55_11820 [Cohnella sp.]